MERLPRALAALSLSMVVGFAGEVFGQQAEGFSLDRFEPAERGSEWFVLESLDLRGDSWLAAGVVGDWARKPLVLYRPDGSEGRAVVSDQVFLHAGVSLISFDRLRLALSVPIALYQGGDSGIAEGVTYRSPAQASLGDVRLGADVRLLGVYGRPFTLAAGVQVHLPTGRRDDYTGDGKVRVTPRVQGAGDLGPVTYAARLAFQYRGLDGDDAGAVLGSELQFAAAVGLRLADRKLVVGPEVYGGTVVSDSDAFLDKRSTPVELIVGAHYLIADQVRAGLGLGPGLSRALGTPQLRVLASLEYAPAYVPPPSPPPPDRDGDGVLDADDACPDVAGVQTDDPRIRGCPPPPDRDGDGVSDADDACPSVVGVKTDDPKTTGCPPPRPDRDADGIPDADDACPDVAGVRTEDPKTTGCPPPPPDRDGDGVLDAEDACPDAAGPRSDHPKTHGCPAARIEAGEIKILEQVKFRTGSARILPESEAILTSVAEILKAHPEIAKVRVEGHTDNVGGVAMNRRLSKRRAEAVAKWLVAGGIEKARLDSEGFGDTRPIQPNVTEEGRRNNRRVEFHIEAGRASPEPAATGPVPEPARPPGAAPKQEGDKP